MIEWEQKKYTEAWNMEIQRAETADLDDIEKIYDRIHDAEEQGQVTIIRLEKLQKMLWIEKTYLLWKKTGNL